jgi:Uma2 family endonuclease
MSTADTTYQVEYPETDGEPMGETDLHIHWMIRIRDILKYRYRGERVYVGADLLIYYAEGEPRKFVSPDVFVVKDCDTHFRRIYKLWEEKKPPHVALEVTSRSTRREDEVIKPHRYAGIGVAEYFLYDPSAEYLSPPLAGFRLTDLEYERIEPNDRNQLECRELGLTLELDGLDLVLRDGRSGRVLPTGMEAEEAAREAAEAAREAAESAREAAESAARAAEARASALEEELRRLRGQGGDAS